MTHRQPGLWRPGAIRLKLVTPIACSSLSSTQPVCSAPTTRYGMPQKEMQPANPASPAG
jgi:hypothetical protein